MCIHLQYKRIEWASSLISDKRYRKFNASNALKKFWFKIQASCELGTCLRSQITAKLVWFISSRTPLEVRRIMQSSLSWQSSQ